jgi:hypothetical protein
VTSSESAGYASLVEARPTGSLVFHMSIPLFHVPQKVKRSAVGWWSFGSEGQTELDEAFFEEVLTGVLADVLDRAF